VYVEQAATMFGGACFFRRRVADLGHGDAQFFSHHSHGFGKGDVLDLLDESENISAGIAAKAVKELVSRVHGKRRGLFLVERAQPRVILRAGFPQLDVLAHNADDVGLLLDGAGEIAGLGHETSVPENSGSRLVRKLSGLRYVRIRCGIRRRNSLGNETLY